MKPPQLADRLLNWFCAPHLREDVLGDLHERYTLRVARMGEARARRRYWLDVLAYVRPEFIKRKTSEYPDPTTRTMLYYHLLLSYRNFRRFKTTFFINLIGLSTGLACAMLIYLWVSDELSMDQLSANNNRIFQVMQNIPLSDGNMLTTENTPGLLAQSLASEIPEVEEAAVVMSSMVDEDMNGILASGNTQFKTNERYVSPNFFRVFSIPLLAGNTDLVLADKNAVVLSEELALKLFHTTQQVVGKTITWNRGSDYAGRVNGPYVVSGIFRKPSHSSFSQFDALFSYNLFFDKYRDNLENWGNSNPSTYILLKPETNAEQVATKIKDYSRAKYASLHAAENIDWIGTLFLQQYSDKYLHNHYENGQVRGGRIAYVKLFSLVALFLLLIACINFMNLATAKASTRLKEIGVKKTMGADRKSLAFQFLSESMLITTLSFLLATGFVILLLPQFNTLTGKNLALDFNLQLLLFVSGIILSTGLLAGSYPAIYLSGFNPVAVLKGKLLPSLGEVWVRKGLVVFQFGISILLIAAVIVIYKQLEFIQTKNLGYNKENIIHFEKEGRLTNKLEPFLAEVRNIPGVVNASSFNHDLTEHHGGTGGLGWPGQAPYQKIEFSALEVDYGLLELLGVRIAQGRSFSKSFGSDSSGIIFNEAAIKAMGLKNPVGKQISLWGKSYQIIGITQNFHFESLYNAVKPCFIRVFPNDRNVLVKIAAGHEQETIGQIKQVYETYNQGLPFDYKFLDQDYQALYAAENRVAILSRYFAGIAILIAYLGLFGLATFMAEQRTKEIGIRKVLGASASSLTLLLSKDFLRLVMIAFFVATPIAWYATHQWLKGFFYKIDLSWWVFGLTGAVAMLIALLTISFQSIKTALVNPVKSLRSE